MFKILRSYVTKNIIQRQYIYIYTYIYKYLYKYIHSQHETVRCKEKSHTYTHTYKYIRFTLSSLHSKIVCCIMAQLAATRSCDKTKFCPRTAAAASSGVAGKTGFSFVPEGQAKTKVNALLTCVTMRSG